MYDISQNTKDLFNQSGSIKRGYLQVVPLSNEEPIILDEDYIKSFTILDDIYTPKSGIVGSIISKQLTFDLYKPVDVNLIDRELDVFVGVEDSEGTVTYIPYGRYIVQKPETDDTTQATISEAFDYMVKFNKEYVSDVTYPCTVLDLLNSICNQVGVSLGTTDFVNSSFEIAEEVFVSGESCRDVLMAIAQISGSYARVGRDNKMYLGLENATSETFIDDNYEKLELNQSYGGVNRVVIRLGQVEGENVTREDVSMQQNGVYEITITDNPFLYTQDLRSQAIDAIWNKLKGFTYYDYTMKGVSRPYLDCGDRITINGYDTILLTHSVKFNGALKDEYSAVAETLSETEYLFKGDMEKALKRTEIIVNKQDQKITQLIEENTTQTNRINSVQSTLDGTVTRVSKTETSIGELETDVSELETGLGNAQQDISDLDTKLDEEVISLQAQIDGQIQFWNGEEIPTLNNEPAVNWTTEEVRNNHRADIYTVIEDVDGELKQGKSYRFDKVNGNWVWVELTDNELSAVQALAQSKAKVFVTTPKPPYNVGDLWLKDKELYECIVAKDASGTYAESDWQKATKYTDDTVAYLAQQTADKAINNQTITATTEESKEFYLTDSAEANCKTVEIFGESSQEVSDYTVNLFDEEYYNNDSLYTAGAYKYTLAKFSGNQTLYFKASLKEGKTAQSGAYIVLSDSAGSPHISNNNLFAIYDGAVVDYGGKDFAGITDLYINIFPSDLACATIFDNYNLWVSTDNISYEPFIPPTPSPRNPSEIESVSGSVTYKSTRKNLWNNGLVSNISDFVVALETGIKIVKTTNGRISPAYNVNLLPGDYKIYGNFISTQVGFPSNCVLAYFILEDGTQKYARFENGISFYLGQKATGLHFYIQSTEEDGVYSQATDFMILKSTETDLTYEPYQESITSIPLLHDLRSLPSGARDRIYNKDGKWYDEQRIGQVIFDGSDDESWVAGTTTSAGAYRYNVNYMITPKQTELLCSHFVNGGVNSSQPPGIIGIHTNLAVGQVAIYTDIATVAEFKTWLSENPTEVIYELAEPIVTEIIDPEMINGLESIKTYKNITNITADAPSILTYYRDVPIVYEYETKDDAEKKYQTTTEKFAEQEVTNSSIRSSVSEINTTISNDLATKTALSTEIAQVNNSVDIKIGETEAQIQEVDGKLETLSEKVTDMSYNFGTQGLRIATSQDANNSLLDNTGIRVYNYNTLQAIFNYKGSGIDKLIVTGTAQIGYLRAMKSTKDGEKVTKLFHLEQLIENLEDLEV